MSDSCNAQQRNLYPRVGGAKSALEYNNGKSTYDDALRRLSWTNPCDVPAIGQNSAALHKVSLRETAKFTDGTHFIHPTEYGKLRHSDHLSFAKLQGDKVGVGILADPNANVYDRLYLGSKSYGKVAQRNARGRIEMAGDIAFKNGDAEDAVPLYSRVVKETPSTFAYEKRCAALAELGRYHEALADAEFILQHSTGAAWGAAAARVKAIKDYINRMKNYEPGYHQATATLICLLRPREHRQLVQSTPSSFGRPNTAVHIGKGMSSMQTMASVMNWDRDGDGNIDMEEFEEGLRSLGYEPKKKERAVFKGSTEMDGMC